MDIAFVVHIIGVDFYDRAADPADFRVPAYVIANLERSSHRLGIWAADPIRNQGILLAISLNRVKFADERRDLRQDRPN